MINTFEPSERSESVSRLIEEFQAGIFKILESTKNRPDLWVEFFNVICRLSVEQRLIMLTKTSSAHTVTKMIDFLKMNSAEELPSYDPRAMTTVELLKPLKEYSRKLFLKISDVLIIFSFDLTKIVYEYSLDFNDFYQSYTTAIFNPALTKTSDLQLDEGIIKLSNEKWFEKISRARKSEAAKQFKKILPLECFLESRSARRESSYCHVWPFTSFALSVLSKIGVENFIIYQDGKPFPVADSLHEDIRRIGLGRYSLWLRSTPPGLYFSTRDNGPLDISKFSLGLKSRVPMDESNAVFAPLIFSPSFDEVTESQLIVSSQTDALTESQLTAPPQTDEMTGVELTSSSQSNESGRKRVRLS